MDEGLVVRDLRVRYGAVLAVDGVDLQVGPRETVALLGANGAGKTSLLAAVSRLVPASGSVHFAGRDLLRSRPDALARAGIIHVPEGRHVFPNLSVHENLQVGRSARGGRAAMSLAEVYDLFPALAALRHRAGWALSGGEQQMVALGRGLLGGPRLLLLDEPSLGLSPGVVRVVFDALAQIRGTVALLVVEQNTAQALSVCDRAYVLSAGTVAMTGTPADLGDRATLLDAVLGQRAVTDLRGAG